MDLKLSKKAKESYNLTATIWFGEEKIKTPLGALSFGIKSGVLSIAAVNCQIPYNMRGFRHRLQPRIRSGRSLKRTDSTKDQESASIDSSIGTKGVSLKSGLKTETSQKSEKDLELEVSDVFDHELCQVRTFGPNDAPKWHFEVKTGDQILWGAIEREKLGKLIATNEFFSIDARFETPKLGVILTNIEGIWPSTLSTNRRSVIRTAALILIRKYLEPYLAKVVIRNG